MKKDFKKLFEDNVKDVSKDNLKQILEKAKNIEQETPVEENKSYYHQRKLSFLTSFCALIIVGIIVIFNEIIIPGNKATTTTIHESGTSTNVFEVTTTTRAILTQNTVIVTYATTQAPHMATELVFEHSQIFKQFLDNNPEILSSDYQIILIDNDVLNAVSDIEENTIGIMKDLNGNNFFLVIKESEIELKPNATSYTIDNIFNDTELNQYLQLTTRRIEGFPILPISLLADY